MRPDAKDGLLVFEPAERGHGAEWLLHLAEGARERGISRALTFAVPQAVAERVRHGLPESGDVPKLLLLSEREVALCNHRKLAVSGLARWWAMRRYLRKSGQASGLFLEMDHLSLPLALGLPMGAGRTVSGILFRPSVHYDRAPEESRGEKLRDLRKNILYRRMLRHPALTRVHSLDDGFPDFARRAYDGGEKVSALVDPAFPPMAPTEEGRRFADEVAGGRRLFVLFGVLSERKGVLALLEALALLDPDVAGEIAVAVAGEIDPSIRDRLLDLKRRAEAVRPMLRLHLEPRHLSAGEIDGLVRRSDFVFAPYQRFVGSSGVLMWAAARGRAVIAQEYGLVGRLVREHGLGIAVDASDPAALARAIGHGARVGPGAVSDPVAMAAFAAARTPEAFVASILDALPESASAPAARYARPSPAATEKPHADAS